MVAVPLPATSSPARLALPRLGIKEQLVFPEVEYDQVIKVRGLDIVMVTTAKTNEEALALLSEFGLPFRK